MAKTHTNRTYSVLRPVKLACGHVKHFTMLVPLPTPGDYLWCLQCMQETHVPYPLPHDVDGRPLSREWRWLCRTKHCPVNVPTGASKAEAVRRASRHIRQHPGHDVHVIAPTGVIAERFGKDPNDLTLFPLPDQESIPF